MHCWTSNDGRFGLLGGVVGSTTDNEGQACLVSVGAIVNAEDEDSDRGD